MLNQMKMKPIRLISLIVLILGFGLNASAQIYDPVDWEFKSEHVKDDQYKIIFHADILKGWNIYSQFIDEGGPVPTSFTFDDSDHFELIEGVTESDNAKKLNDPIFDMKVIKFFEYADFTQIIKVSDPSKPITGYLTFMTCDKERCLPPTDVEFSVKVKPKQSNQSGSLDDAESSASASTTTSIPQSESAQIQESPSIVTEEKSNKVANELQERVNEEESDDTEDSGEVQFDVAEGEFDGGIQSDGILKPAKWSYSFKKISDTEYDLVMKASIDDGWQAYSQFVEEGGPLPTEIIFDESEVYQKKGDATEVSSKTEVSYDPVFDMKLTKFKKDLTLTQRIEISNPEEIIHGFIAYMVCTDEKCIPFDEEFSFDLANNKAISGDLTAVNTVGPNIEDGKIIDNTIPKLQETYKDPIGNCGEEENAEGKGLLSTFILGFAGGLLALLTPCVFPMIPLTVSFFTKDTKRKGWMNGALYGLSIVVIYVGLGILLTLVFGADVLNRLSTNWIANTIFFAIFMFFAFSFFGFYEITLPSSIANSSDSMADKGGLIGIFFMAFTLAVVSFSCTGPIIGSALVAATSKGLLGPAVVMFGFALALALPFGLFAAFPAWLNTLPRSGGWMNSVKVMLGFLEVALAFKFLSVADMTSHWGFLRYELFMGIWVLVAIGMALYMFGLIKFPHDSPVKKLNATRWVFGLGMTAMAIYLASGFLINDKTKSYDSLKMMSGLAPPANYNFFIPPPSLDQDIKDRFPSYTKCANNLDCFKDYYEGLSYAKEVEKPILLDFTGYGCVNCRKTEEHIWVRDEVWSKISEDYVLISLYVDDRQPMKEEIYLPESRRPIPYVGKMWANFQEVNFQQNSQPLYVLVTPDEEVLAKPRGYKSDVKSYDEFLECGLETFETHKSKLLGSRQ